MNWLYVVLGAMVGAPLRYLTDRVVQARTGSALPWGRSPSMSPAVCSSACSPGPPPPGVAGSGTQLLLGTGLCGALTTYSTFSYETLRLAESGALGYAAANVLVSTAAGLGAAYAGAALAGAVWP